MKELDAILEKYFGKKAPKLPADFQKLIVQYGPYVLLISVVITALQLVSVYVNSLSFFSAMNMFGRHTGTAYQIYFAFAAIILVLNGLALPGLFNKSMSGWKFLFYAAVVALVQNILIFNLGGIIVGSGLSFYVLYQIKGHYS